MFLSVLLQVREEIWDVRQRLAKDFRYAAFGDAFKFPFIAMKVLESKRMKHITLSWSFPLPLFLRQRLVSAMKEFRPDVLLS